MLLIESYFVVRQCEILGDRVRRLDILVNLDQGSAKDTITPDKKCCLENLFFLFLHKNMLWVLIRKPCRGTSNENPQHVFLE